MSAPDSPPPSGSGYTGGQIALIFFGVVFVLPGACSLVFALEALTEFLKRGRVDPYLGAFAPVWMICFAISALGIVMIIMARRRARRPS